MENVIHSTAIIDPGAVIGERVKIGAFTQIHKNVIIGDGCIIESYCEIGVESPLASKMPLVIGKNSTIRSHSIFYESSSFGDGLVTGHRVTVRENTIAGENLQAGTLCDIQGDCLIGNFVRFHSNVHIGKKSKIGNFVWIFPYVVLTNDPTPPSETLLGVSLGDYSVIATMSVILPGVSIGQHALVAASACVGIDVPEKTIAAGVPAKVIGFTSKIKQKNNENFSSYPWPKYFHRGYPSDVIEGWIQEFSE